MYSMVIQAYTYYTYILILNPYLLICRNSIQCRNNQVWSKLSECNLLYQTRIQVGQRGFTSQCVWLTITVEYLHNERIVKDNY